MHRTHQERIVSTRFSETCDSAVDPWRVTPVTIHRMHSETPGVITYDLAFDRPEIFQNYNYRHGQFNMLYVPGVGESAISIAGHHEQRQTIRHTIRSVGSVTQALQQSGVGGSLGLRGPFGSSWPLDLLTQTLPADLVLAAGGLGLAPLRSLIEHIVEHRSQFGEVTLLIGARTSEDLLYFEEYGRWRAHRIRVKTTVDRPDGQWGGHVGVVTLLLDRTHLTNPQSTILLTCGPEVMMRYVAKSAMGRGIPQTNIWVTLERNMNCAVGLCGHCQLGPEFLCKDGPVFRLDRVAPWLRVQEF